MHLIELLIGLLAGSLVAALAAYFIQRQRQTAGKDVLALARLEADTIKTKAQNLGREEWAKKEQRRKQDLRQRDKKLQQKEQQLKARESEIRSQSKVVRDLESDVVLKEKVLEHKEESLKTLKDDLKRGIDEQSAKLEEIACKSMDEARHDVLEMARVRYEEEAAVLASEIKGAARESASREAREIITTAIEKEAAPTTGENTIKEVEIPNNRIKGMVIGREGRNIKAFEAITDTKMIVDDMPDTIVISSFDPVKREIARITLESLIKSRNFTPRSVKEAAARAKRTVDNQMNEAASKVLKELRLSVHPELKRLLGRLRFRTSYGQNVLDHSREVARITGAMAAELGLDVALAKRAGLLHDVGKADSNGSERSHVAIGLDVCTRVREHPVVINSVLAHHKEAPPIDPISELVTAADIISSSRPGSRRDSVDAYAKRVETLENIAAAFPGIHRVYALYAGREVRVVTEADKMSDAMSEKLSSDIALKISQEMQFPGTIKVVVIRETRSISQAS
jgi:ribonucrease Y